VREQPQEAREVHARLIKAGLEIDASRAYWAHTDGSREVSAREAFDGYWFGARSHARVKDLLANMRVRYDAYPNALATLHRWRGMQPDTRRLVCHWHLMLADPTYRVFAGTFLPERRERAAGEVRADVVSAWIERITGARWTIPTRIKIATRLLAAGHDAGLIQGTRNARSPTLPRVPNDALTYLLYLLRETGFEGTLLQNPYLSSVGLEGDALDGRLRGLPDLAFTRQTALIDFGWRYPHLRAWADATVAVPSAAEPVA
jgi:hypothetical protein